MVLAPAQGSGEGPRLNFQNIPRSEKLIKAGFVPKLDAYLFFDYKAIELRLLAYYLGALGDMSMAKEFRAGADPHLETAKGIYGREVTDEERQVGKTMNFSMVYGGGAPTLVRQGVAKDFPEAKKLLSAFHAARPGIGMLQRRIQERMAERGYITTLWGRHLHPQEEHKALNALIQGCAADLMRDALRKVHRYLNGAPFGMQQAASLPMFKVQPHESHLVSVIHDELILDCRKSEIEELVQVVPVLMDAPAISEVVPVETDCEISFTTWADKESYADAA